MTRAAFIYDDEQSKHVYREDHVMRPTRLRYTYELLQAYGVFDPSRIFPPLLPSPLLGGPGGAVGSGEGPGVRSSPGWGVGGGGLEGSQSPPAPNSFGGGVPSPLSARGEGPGVRSLLVTPRPATPEELLWFHTPDYVRAVKALSRGDRTIAGERYNFSEHGDNPPFSGMYEAGTLATGASLAGAEMVARGEVDVAFNVSGGLHHAMAGHASGFCVFNDPVIAIEYLRRQGLRPAYVDIDCHHGDGVQAAFYKRDDVMTISLHESGRFLFPGTGEVEELGSGPGRGYAVNVPLAPYTQDEVYAWAFGQVVPPLLAAFKPDVLVTQLGIDTHFNDPITHLKLTVEGHGAIVRRLGDMAPRWLALGGGGYDMSAVARGWTLDYGIMMGVDLPDEVPQEYRGRYGLACLRDGAGAPPLARSVVEDTRRFAEDSVRKVQRLIFPAHQISV